MTKLITPPAVLRDPFVDQPETRESGDSLYHITLEFAAIEDVQPLIKQIENGIDLAASIVVPIGWSKFDLALHPWDEPAIRLVKEAESREVAVASPMIGEVFDLEEYPETRWWERLRAEFMQLIYGANS